ERRCTWLSEMREHLGLTNVEVKRGRAEEFHGAFEADAVTARAVAAPRTAPESGLLASERGRPHAARHRARQMQKPSDQDGPLGTCRS
ncbi:RsmG family class I SAM-dependent methyltransferase, partial [Streptomyces smyrnaeus]|uniref:RsmG family class I SAM-dependent methyltransferase n=1 Tax=Streptomyces smyrnaeus TaxID=1387713 RepID=UPI0036CC8AEF